MQKFGCRWFSEESCWDQHLSGVKQADRSERGGELKAISTTSSVSSKNCGPGWPERGAVGNTSSARVRAQSRPALCDPPGLKPTRLLCPWNFPGKNTGMGCHFLLQGIFLNQGSNPHLLSLLHWQMDSLPLCHLGSPSHREMDEPEWAWNQILS